MKLKDIIADGMKRDLLEENVSSLEISGMYVIFKQLIRTRKFENNDFLNKEDAIAVIDLAEACNMFLEEEPPNFKASGICFNNIGNIQYKTGKFDQAADNFELGVQAAKQHQTAIKNGCESKITAKYLKKKHPSKLEFRAEVNYLLQLDDDWTYFHKVEAHRSYLKAMSIYKHLRYGSQQGKQKWADVD